MSTDLLARPEHHLEDMTTRIKPRTASNLLLWGIAAFFVIAITWAALTTVDRSIHASGRIIPGSRLQIIQNMEGGIVSEILVKAGEVVKKGQRLIALDKTVSGATLGAEQATAGALAVKLARLEAEVQGREPVYPAPGDNQEMIEQIQLERALHASRIADLNSASTAARARVAQAQRAVAEAQAAHESRSSARRSYEQQVAMIRPLVDRGIEPRMTLVQLESNLAIATSDLAAASATIARAQAAVAEANATLTQLRQDWRRQAATELTAARAEYLARSQAMRASADRARRTDVIAPMDGRINRVLVTTVGGVVAPGAPMAELVPSDDLLVVEALVNPKDIGFVRLGQPARINVSAYDSAIYGSMDGEVVTISPDATVDERSGESHYMVRVNAKADSLKDQSGKVLRLGPGMTADVSLLGDKRSILSYILTPITRLSQRAMRE